MAQKEQKNTNASRNKAHREHVRELWNRTNHINREITENTIALNAKRSLGPKKGEYLFPENARAVYGANKKRLEEEFFDASHTSRISTRGLVKARRRGLGALIRLKNSPARERFLATLAKKNKTKARVKKILTFKFGRRK